MKKILQSVAVAAGLAAGTVHGAGAALNAAVVQRIEAGEAVYEMKIWRGGEAAAVVFVNHTAAAVHLQLAQTGQPLTVSARGALQFACEHSAARHLWIADPAGAFSEYLAYQCGDSIALRLREVTR